MSLPLHAELSCAELHSDFDIVGRGRNSLKLTAEPAELRMGVWAGKSPG